MVGAVLTGGSSRRMGRDKALVEISGRTLVEICVAALTDGGADEVVLVGGDASALGSVVPRARWVADLSPGEGPLGGLLTAFAASPGGATTDSSWSSRATCPGSTAQRSARCSRRYGPLPPQRPRWR